jgi:HAD superfamily hydrolase (TIGR01490 family)
MRAAAIFDLDGTLLSGTSAERLWVQRAVRTGLLSPLHLAAGAAWAWAAWALRRTASPFEQKPYLRGACAPWEELAGVCVASDVLPRLRPRLVARVAEHRAAGDIALLLTGTPDVLGTRIAAALNFDAVIASRLERCGDRFTGRVLPPHPYGDGKRVALAAWAARAGVDLGRSHAYANRSSDIAHLEAVGHAHAVAADRGLRRVAAARGWRVWEEDAWMRAGVPERPSPPGS